MVAVVGATGNTGRAVVKELRALGEDPLCIVRTADKAREVLGANARTAVVDITDRPALQKALQGVKRVFVVTGHNPQAGDQQINILKAAKTLVLQARKISGGYAYEGGDDDIAYFPLAARLRNLALSGPPVSPSFDCQTARSEAEKAICRDARLAQLDLELAAANGAALARLSGTTRRELVAEQRRWIERRNGCGGSISCLQTIHRERVSEIHLKR
jgi:uncharacterized protein YecT (DUF1311 family)